MSLRLPDEVTREIAQLRQRVEDLESELKRRDAIVEVNVQRLRQHFNLTIGEARMVELMADGNAHTREQLIMAHNANIEVDRAIDTHIKRIRKKGEIAIRTHYGIGYGLTPESVENVRAVLRGKQ